MLVYGAGLMEETLILQPGQQTSPIMAGEIRNLSPQTLVQMENGMTTTEIQLDHPYVSITQVLNEYLPYPIYPFTVTKDLSSMIYYACHVYQ